MGRVKPTSTTLRAQSQLRFIAPARAVFAASVQRGPFGRDQFRDRSPAGARYHEELTLEVRWKVSARFLSRNAALSPERWQCHPGIHRPLPASSRPVAGRVFAAPLWETKARR